MDENRHEADKIDDLMLPGFRFHPTDEELVAFYLRRKIQHQPLPIELIKQVDIYKFDPWDLPKLAATGEKECYFYCPRDRKYRNSTRPNRVTGAGFWKATGTDRPIYSSNGAKCVGLKKSLVFYRGRAAKGMKTDWMMHEFRLPSISDSIPAKKLLDKGIPANDSWVICRIFKKTSPMAQRALACSWLASVREPPELFNQSTASSAQFSQDSTSCTTEVGSAGFDFPFYKLINPTKDHPTNTPIFPTLDMSPSIPKSPYSSLLLNLSPAFPSDMGKTDETPHFEAPNQHLNSFPFSSLLDLSSGAAANPGGASIRSSMPFPFAFPAPSWESPSELSTGYSSNKCYT